MIMPSLQKRQRRDLQELTPDCDSKTWLLTKAEYISLAVSLVGVPALATHNARALNSLACALVKGLNSTSQALDALNRELKQVREATLENRAAIDYLLLRHNHGCEEFKGLCCFNLSDQSQLIEDDIRRLKELTHKIGYENSPFDFLSGLFDWLPNLHWLKILILGAITVTIAGILLGCLPQIIQPCLNFQRTCFSLKHVSIMMSRIDHDYQIYSDNEHGWAEGREMTPHSSPLPKREELRDD